MKIAILGTAPHYQKAPFDDKSWEIWAANSGADGLPRLDRWFELHDDASIDTYPGHREKMAEFAASGRTLHTKDNFPAHRMADIYGTWFFTSTIAYMLAVALECAPTAIGLWGVDMGDQSEYMAQKPGCRFFIQLAKMRGIEVVMPPEAEVGAPGKLYCFDPPSPLTVKVKAKVDELHQRFMENEAARTNLMLEKALVTGGLSLRDTPKELLEARLAEATDKLASVERTSLVLDGGLQLANHIAHNWTGD